MSVRAGRSVCLPPAWGLAPRETPATLPTRVPPGGKVLRAMTVLSTTVRPRPTTHTFAVPGVREVPPPRPVAAGSDW